VRSAVEGLDAVLLGLQRRLDVLKRTPRRYGLASRLTVVAIDGGAGWGVVPETATARCELRVLPGNEQKRIEAAVRKAFAESVAEAGVTGRLKFADGGLRWMAPSSVPAGSRIVKAAVNGWRSVLGRAPELGCFPGGTDARLLQAAGIQSVIIGPGALARAHHPDEYVTVAELSVAERLYERIADRFLNGVARV
jgi:acetylornithine deacetylase/succinyl-diaminopimelate desuccinylase-like protein